MAGTFQPGCVCVCADALFLGVEEHGPALLRLSHVLSWIMFQPLGFKKRSGARLPFLS